MTLTALKNSRTGLKRRLRYLEARLIEERVRCDELRAVLATRRPAGHFCLRVPDDAYLTVPSDWDQAIPWNRPTDDIDT